MNNLADLLNRVHTADCLPFMENEMPPECIDTIITDSPYGLEFMGKNWDHSVPGIPYWAAALRVAKPGAILLAFGGTRTYHRLACNIEDAGWEITDQIIWLYGSGFPKSMSLSLAIDRAACQKQLTEKLGRKPTKEEFDEAWKEFREVVGRRTDRAAQPIIDIRKNGYGACPQDRVDHSAIHAPTTDLAKVWNGWGTALKPAWEPIIVAMKPIDGTFANNAERHGVTGFNVDGSRIGTGDDLGGGATRGGNGGGSQTFDGLKNRKLENYNQPSGRFPANVILDPESAAMLDAQCDPSLSSGGGGYRKTGVGGNGIYGEFGDRDLPPKVGYEDFGGPSRFFYCAKASPAERNEGLEYIPPKKRDPSRHADQPSMNGGGGNPFNRGAKPVKNNHPTVKPLKLMEYLCRLTMTPTGGIVLDPFCGSGSTLIAAKELGRPFIGIEIEPEYCRIAEARLKRGTLL